MTVYGKPRWRRWLTRSLRVHTRYWVLIGVGVMLALGAGTAAAAIALSGRGLLVAPSYEEKDLQVTDERLSVPLTPGGSSDLLFTVRNPNPFPARIDRVSLASALRKSKPAGCTAKVSGPLVRPDGYALPAARRVTVPAGGRLQVTIPAAFKLAGSARGGCGFTVDILVNATQATATVTPSPARSVPNPNLPPKKLPPTAPATTVATTTSSAAPPPALPSEGSEEGLVPSAEALG